MHCTLHQTVPQVHAGNRVLEIATGLVAGRMAACVNAQVYMRGYRADYDQWRASAGSDLWSWETMLPHFRRLEGNQKYSGEFSRCCAGPLTVADPGFFCEYSHLFVKPGKRWACHSPRTSMSAPRWGTGYLQFTARGGRRCSTAEAFLGRCDRIPAFAS